MSTTRSRKRPSTRRPAERVAKSRGIPHHGLLCLPVERDAILKAKWWGRLPWVQPFAWSLDLDLATGTTTATIHLLGILLVVHAAAAHAAFIVR